MHSTSADSYSGSIDFFRNTSPHTPCSSDLCLSLITFTTFVLLICFVAQHDEPVETNFKYRRAAKGRVSNSKPGHPDCCVRLCQLKQPANHAYSRRSGQRFDPVSAPDWNLNRGDRRGK